MAQLISNTTQDFKCIQCGNSNVSVIRQSDDPRLRCNACKMMFNASQSKAAEAAGALPSPAENERSIDDSQIEPARKIDPRTSGAVEAPRRTQVETRKTSIPRNPDFVLISGDRRQVEYVREKDLKKTLLRWEGKEIKYQLYSLTEKKAEVKVDIDAS